MNSNAEANSIYQKKMDASTKSSTRAFVLANASPPTQDRGWEEGEDEAQDATETASMLPAMFTPKKNSRYAIT